MAFIEIAELCWFHVQDITFRYASIGHVISCDCLKNLPINIALLAHLSQWLKWAIVIGLRPASGVRRRRRRKLFTFSTSSPEPLKGFWWNWVGLKYSWSPTSVVVFRPDPSSTGKSRSRRGTLLWQTSSSERKHVSTNRKHQDDLETRLKKCSFFWFHFEVKFLTRFWYLFGLCQKCSFFHHFFQ